ncbi:MAG: ribbon-helix-helix domain-containing protein [Pyrobaculum sp.]|uniref:ribbon-helix-helix domain-containing protein n=1 Tax=Pyrobaculum sp. TaxID=2004705 RepID=UPI00316E84D3
MGRPKSAVRKEDLSVRIDEEIAKKLDYVAKQTKTPQVAVVEDAIEKFLAKNPTHFKEELVKPAVFMTFRIRADLYWKLVSYAKEHKVTLNGIVREALRDYLKDIKIDEESIDTKTTKQTVSVRVLDEVMEQIKRYGKPRTNLSKVVEDILTEYIERNWEKQLHLVKELGHRKPVKIVVFVLPTSLVKKIDELALKNRIRRGDIIRAALEEFAKKIKEEEATAKSVS